MLSSEVSRFSKSVFSMESTPGLEHKKIDGFNKEKVILFAGFQIEFGLNRFA